MAVLAIAVLAGQTAASASVLYLQSQKATFSGKKIEIDRTSEVELNCTFHAFPGIELIGPPAHGKVSTERHKSFPNFPASNPRAKCNTRKIDGLVIYYTPNPRFIGTDTVKYRVAFSDGSVREISTTIDVN